MTWHDDPDGDLVVHSPCCDQPGLVRDWMVVYARRYTDGVVRVQCGRDRTDPLRAAGAVPWLGCGQWYRVDVAAAGRPQ